MVDGLDEMGVVEAEEGDPRFVAVPIGDFVPKILDDDDDDDEADPNGF